VWHLVGRGWLITDGLGAAEESIQRKWLVMFARDLRYRDNPARGMDTLVHDDEIEAGCPRPVG
jgi:hypothetical protein